MKIIGEWVRKRIILAQAMSPGQLVQSYRDSLKIEENPLSGIYEGEILERLFGHSPVPSYPKP